LWIFVKLIRPRARWAGKSIQLPHRRSNSGLMIDLGGDPQIQGIERLSFSILAAPSRFRETYLFPIARQ